MASFLVLYDGTTKYKFKLAQAKFYTRSQARNLGATYDFTSIVSLGSNINDGAFSASGKLKNPSGFPLGLQDCKSSYANNNSYKSTWFAYTTFSNSQLFCDNAGTSIKSAVQQVAGGGQKTLTNLDGTTQVIFDGTTSGYYRVTFTKNNLSVRFEHIDTYEQRGDYKFLPQFCYISNQTDYTGIPAIGVNVGAVAAIQFTQQSYGNEMITACTVGYSMVSGGYHEQTNPYEDGGFSGHGGGDPNKQNFSDESDLVSADNMPDESTYGATSCGLVTIFKPSKSQLKHLADVMWGTDVISFLQNMVENISSMFISLAMVPFNVDAGATVSVQWLGLIDTAISLTLAGKQWYEFNMGSIALDGTDDRIWATDSVLDYSPFSKLGIYLPFIGYQELDIDECRNHVLTLTYRIDILSGTCLALIDVNGRTIYQFTGNCLTQLPLTSMDAQSLFTNAVNVGIAAASAGSAGAVASAGDAFTQERVASGKLSEAGAELQNQQKAAQVANAEGSLAGATANGMMGMKPSFKKTGAISASSSLFGVMQPYLFLTTPKQSVPERYEHFCGLPCNITGKLGDFSGLTVVEDVRLNGLVATSPEVEEIYNLLKTGIII